MATAAVSRSRALESPTGPSRETRTEVMAGDAGRVAAFVFDLDALFDARALEMAMARSAARELARARGLDPLWTEVLVLEIARESGGENAVDSLRVLSGEPLARGPLPRAALATIAPREEAEETLARLRHRFKLGLVSSRPASDACRILEALGLGDAFDATAFGEPDGDDARPAAARVVERLGEHASACVLVARPHSPSLASGRLLGLRGIGLLADGPGRVLPGHGGAEIVVDGLALLEGLAAGAASRYSDASFEA